MDFAELAAAFERMDGTAKRLEITSHLVGLLESTPRELVPQVVYMIQGRLRPSYEGVEIGVAEKLAVAAISKASGRPAAEVEEGLRAEGDLGRAASGVMGRRVQTTFSSRAVTVERVYDTLFRIAGMRGARSQDMKLRHISSLLSDAGALESRYILKLLLGTLRLGVAENTIMDALAAAFTGDKANRGAVERAYNVCSDLGRVAEAAARGGAAELEGFGVSLFSPVRPMLADRARSEEGAAEKMPGGAYAEYKLDGERVQAHVGGGRVELFSRRTERITHYYPDIVEGLPGALSLREAILEGEAVAVSGETGRFLPFQELMHRRRKHGVERAAAEYPVTLNLFDVLYADGRSMIDAGYEERRAALEVAVREGDLVRCVPSARASSAADLAESMEASIGAGCEGIMVKAPGSPYKAGSRGGLWLKLKREYRNELGDSLDLVVVGAYFGKGRRTGRYGTLLLSAYDRERDAFPTVCKVGTGFTDEHLDQLYQNLSPTVARRRDPRVDSSMEADVWFSPSLVMEVVASEVTLSPVHRAAYGAVREGAGLALRFPKFTGRLRPDKAPEDASADEEVVALYRGQAKTGGS